METEQVTFEEAKEVIFAIQFRGLFRGMTVELARNMWLEGWALRFVMPTWHVDTGEKTVINSIRNMPENLDMDALLAHVHLGVVDLATHEAREAIHYKGRRPFDPHASEGAFRFVPPQEKIVIDDPDLIDLPVLTTEKLDHSTFKLEWWDVRTKKGTK